MLDMLQLHCCTSVSSLLLLTEESTATVFRCMCDGASVSTTRTSSKATAVRFPKTSNTDVRNQGRGTVVVGMVFPPAKCPLGHSCLGTAVPRTLVPIGTVVPRTIMPRHICPQGTFMPRHNCPTLGTNVPPLVPRIECPTL